MARNVYRKGKKSVSVSASGAVNVKLGKVRLTGSKLEVKTASGRGIFPLRGVQFSKPVPNDYLPGGGERLFTRSQQRGLEIKVNFVVPEEGPCVGICAEVKNLQRAVVSLERIILMRIPLRKIAPIGSAPKPYMFIDSNLSSGQTGLHSMTGEGSEDEIPRDTSENCTALYVPGGDCFFAGILMEGKTRNTLSFEQDRFVVTADFNCEIRPYSYVETDLLVLNGMEPLGKALNRFGNLQNRRRRAAEASGFHAWTSSNWYERDVSESDIMDSLEFIRKTPWLKNSLQYVVVGKGWQEALGDWEPSERFPSSMPALAGRIRDAGFSPGIWIAPLTADSQSSLATENPGWMLKSKDKKEQVTNQLDFTLPDVRDYVYECIRRLRNWGYSYFQTDFSGCDPDPAAYRFRGPTGSALRSFKTIMTAVRAAMGEDSFWVAHNVPLNLVPGLCDAVLCCGHMSPYYSTMLNGARSGMHRHYQHGRIWLIDPGLLLVRGPETAQSSGLIPGDNADGPYKRYALQAGPMLRKNEARLWGTWIIMSGGLATLGDRLATLRAEGLTVVRKVLQRAGSTPAVPLDFGVVPLPRIWHREEGQTALLALFNWSEKESDIVVGEKHHVEFPESRELFEVWTEQTVEVAGRNFKRRVPPHSCELFEWDL